MTSAIVTKDNLFVSRFKVDPEKKAEFLAIFEALADGALPVLQAETNLIFWGWGRDGTEFVAIESWKNEDVVNQVRATAEFKTAVGALLACCTAPMTMELFSGMEGSRGVFDIYPSGPSRVHPSNGKIKVEFI
jgi:quinol monooxygenase YgiN